MARTQFRNLAVLKVAKTLFVLFQFVLRLFAVALRRSVFLVWNVRSIGQNVIETVNIHFARNIVLRRVNRSHKTRALIWEPSFGQPAEQQKVMASKSLPTYR